MAGAILIASSGRSMKNLIITFAIYIVSAINACGEQSEHLTSFGNASRESESVYYEKLRILSELIPDFLDWERRGIIIPYNYPKPRSFEVRVIFKHLRSPKAHVAVLVSCNKHLVERQKVDLSTTKASLVWRPDQFVTDTNYGRCDGHFGKQAAFVLEGELESKEQLNRYIEKFDFNTIAAIITE